LRKLRCAFQPSFSDRSTSPTGARAMPAQTERPLKTIFQSRHRRSHLFFTRTSYLIVKEHRFTGSDFHQSTQSDPPSAGEFVISDVKEDGRLTHA